LKHFIIDRSSREECKELFRNQLTLIRRVLFSRSLRLLPLPEQVGAVEALAVIIDQMPEVIPLTDQHLLAFLSELLKMSSVADGEMSDSNLVGHVVDKNGFAVSVEDAIPSGKDQNSYVCSSHASSIFLRRECIVNAHNAKIVVAEELPFGVQLRVSSICLLRSVIRGQPDPFFDAEASTPVGKGNSDSLAVSHERASKKASHQFYSRPYLIEQEISGRMLSVFSFGRWFRVR
jgi:transformation/transcription domain-associated protein